MTSHSLKRNESQTYDGNESRLSDEIRSLDSWSESIGLSSSLSESLTSAGKAKRSASVSSNSKNINPHRMTQFQSMSICDSPTAGKLDQYLPHENMTWGMHSEDRFYDQLDTVQQGTSESRPKILPNTNSYRYSDSRSVNDESPSHDSELSNHSANRSRGAESDIFLSSSVDPVANTEIRQKSQEQECPKGLITLQAQNLASDLNSSTTCHHLSGPALPRETSHIYDYHNARTAAKSRPLHFPHYFKNIQKGKNDGYVRTSSQTGTYPRTDRLPERETSPATFVIHSRQRLANVDYTTHTARSSSSPRLHVSQPNMSDPIFSNVTLRRQEKSSSDLESLNEASEHRLEPENVKTKMMSVWNNIKYGWTFKSKTNMKYDSPLYLLGKCYHRRREADESSDPEEEFMKDFASRIWLTYRSNFYPIPGTKLCTDCGWGCMLRSGQMLIAQCLITHFLGRDWRMYNEQTETEGTFYREIIRWFSDPIDSSPSDKVPFCLHHLVNFGRSYNKSPGEWYGPASVAYIFRDAFSRASLTMPVLSQLCLYVAQDCTVYLEDVNYLCTAREKSESMSGSVDLGTCLQALAEENHDVESNRSDQPWVRSLILLIPMRLGGEMMNEIYTPCVRRLLSHDNCMGIIGGKPKHSLYFIGWQDDKLIYLDPHFCRDAVNTSRKDFKIETFHCMFPRKIAINRMDPSCTVGFYIKDADEFRNFVHEVQEFIAPPKQRGTYPLFIFEEGTHLAASKQHGNRGIEKGRVKVTHYHIDENGQRQRTATRESEEFIML